AVKNINFSVKRGECIAFCGLNGSGKSTLFKALSNADDKITISGNIFLNSKLINKLNAKQRLENGICLVPEERHIFKQLTVKENLILGSYLLKDKKEINNNIENFRKKYSAIDKYFNKKAGLLSGGEQQIIAIVRGLLSNPDILIADEPCMGLSPYMQNEIIKIIKELKTNQKTILFSSMESNDFLNLADKIIYMKKGEIIFFGDINKYEIFKKSNAF
ncbi:MAG: ATP-binding cassette domain-containing protein, partial [Oscillospiraceae bacterium]